MNIFRHIEDWLDYRKTLPPELSLGFVPTMGNLHAGHASLFAKSIEENDQTVVSIFVNPTQFNKLDDFRSYPRTLEEDLHLLEKSGVNYCLLPEEQAMYKEGYTYQVQETLVSLCMEGLHRPGHFNGVLTVVLKLLNLVKPRQVYFGEKDYQQYLLIKGMVDAFFLPVSVKACPTIREPSGLAYSSRNNRLNPNQRLQAETFARIFHQNKSCERLKQELEAQGIIVEYMIEQAGRRYAAILIDEIRLIDNYAL